MARKKITKLKKTEKKNLKNGIYLFLVGLVAVLIVTGSSGDLFTGYYIPSGYDGPTAEIVDVYGGSQAWDVGDGEDYWNSGSSAGYDSLVPWVQNPTGIKASIDIMPNVDMENAIELEGIPDVEEILETFDDGTERVKLWRARKIKCDMGITVSTYGDGLDQVRDITWIIQLKANDYSVFSGADETISFILLVEILNVTGDRPVGDEGAYVFWQVMEDMVIGQALYMDPIETGELPDWLIDSGMNLVNLQKLQTVNFNIRMITGGLPLGAPRVESQFTYKIGFDLLLFGEWDFTRDIHDWKPPIFANLWDVILDGLDDLKELFGEDIMMIITIVIVAFAGVLLIKILIGARMKRQIIK